MTTERDLLMLQPKTGWTMYAIVQERKENVDELDRFREAQIRDGLEPWQMPQDRQEIESITKMFRELFFLYPPEDPLKATHEGVHWLRKTTF